MATETICHCDKCGQRITHARTNIAALCGPHRHRPGWDMCSGCADALVAWLSTPPGSVGSLAATAPRPAPLRGAVLALA